YDSNTGIWTVSGSVDDVNAALAAVAFTPAADWDQDVTITTQIRDAANAGPANGTITLDVTAVNDAPTVSNLTQTLPYTEDPGSAVALGDIVVTDVDSGDTVTATLTLSNTAAGSLTTGTFGSASSGYDSNTGIWTVSGSVDDVNAALAAVAFTPAANLDQAVTITTQIRDAANAGPANGIITLDVTAVNDAPTVAGVPATVTVTEDSASDLDLSAIAFTDVDNGATLTVTFTAGAGTLAASDGTGVTVGGSSTALTLTGTVSAINTYLDTVGAIKYTSA
ncbi:hypothetical protein, partial [Thalassospira sp. MCCC 1A01428]|uniref:hypothetical protein n=1 Tax=Thalassospira sp. MCCC 1A01428 TaxID=1470575 RepID=UPI000A23D5B1